VYQAIREELAAGGRVYIVCPLVSASAGRGGGAAAAAGDSSDGEGGGAAASSGSGGGGDPKRTVMDEWERLTRAGVFGPENRVGFLHGRLTGDEKAQALRDFSRWARGRDGSRVPAEGAARAAGRALSAPSSCRPAACAPLPSPRPARSLPRAAARRPC
jgi:hypothetical protein